MRHHRRAGGGSERPRCAVCREPYAGHEVRPGIVGFARQQVQEVVQQLGRSAGLVLLLMGFQEFSHGQKDSFVPMPARTAFLAFFWAACIYRFATLAVSLPPERPPPRGRLGRRLHVGDPQRLAKNMAEALSVVVVLGLWCFRGELPIIIFLPFGAAALSLILRMSAQYPSFSEAVAIARNAVRSVLALPVAAGRSLVHLVWQRPLLRWAHPRNAEPHIAVAVISGLLVFMRTSNTPLVALWYSHCSVLAMVMLEHALGNVALRQSVAWWYAMQLAVVIAYIANAMDKFRGGLGGEERTGAVVLQASAMWVAEVCLVAMVANRAMCMQYYRSWQRQHGVFTLAAPAVRVVQLNRPMDEDLPV